MGNGAEPFKNVKAMLYAPTGAIICPFKLTIALAEMPMSTEWNLPLI